MAVMTASHHLCSHLVRLRADDREQWVNLEEIWATGAVLECEEEVPVGALTTISADDATFCGRATAVERHEFGWRVELVFSSGTPWNVELWKPEHLLDPGKFAGEL